MGILLGVVAALGAFDENEFASPADFVVHGGRKNDYDGTEAGGCFGACSPELLAAFEISVLVSVLTSRKCCCCRYGKMMDKIAELGETSRTLNS